MKMVLNLVIGLVEREWLDTLANINRDEVDYTDYVDAASMLATELKRKGEYCVKDKLSGNGFK